MKENQGAIILTERAADYGRLSAILREWGYRENEIQHLLGRQRVDEQLDERRKTLINLGPCPRACPIRLSISSLPRSGFGSANSLEQSLTLLVAITRCLLFKAAIQREALFT